MIFPKLPGPTELAPYLQQLENHPGSLVLLAFEVPSTCNFARCTAAWLSREERRTLKATLEKARKRRALLRQEARGDLASVSEGKEAQATELMQANKPIDPSTGEPIPNPKPDPRIPDDWPPKPPPHRGRSQL
jgi:hypothetical protein